MSRIQFALFFLLASLLMGCEEAPSLAQLGGHRLVFKIKSKPDSFDVALAQKKLTQRLDPSGRIGIEVQIGDQVEVSVPAVKGVDLDAIGSKVTSESSLSLFIVAKKTDLEIADWVEEMAASKNPAQSDRVSSLASWVSVVAGSNAQPTVVFSDENFTREIDGKSEVLCRRSDMDIHSEHFESASKTVDHQKQLAIDFQLTDEGTKRMETLTSQNIGRRLAIVFTDRIVSAPTINSQISNRGQISGRFTEQEVDDLVSTLAAGPLPFKIANEPPQVIPVAAPE